ncbi:MAG: hypothetical protein R3190_02975 [Thermoanaerobaculia bacterium]|nr:hypothetical protein [Thermoanaerobaculia bacterium]
MAVRPSTLIVFIAFAIACGDAADDPPVAATGGGKVEVLSRGAAFRGVNGILVGPDGLLWAASVVTPAIAAFDTDSGDEVLRLGPESGIAGPDDLAFGPDGSLYWTDISVGNVGRRSPDGSVRVVASPGPGVNPITFSDDGRLFVSQCFFDHRLFEIDPDGEEEPRLITDQLGPGCGLNGMDWGPDDRLYGPRWFQGEVVKVDVDSGSWETVADGFGVPAAVKFDSRQRLHVLDSLAGEVWRVEGGERELVARVDPSTADNLAFGADDRLFVSSFGDGWVVEILGVDEQRVLSPGGLNMPGGVALAIRDGVAVAYVADFFALRGLDAATGRQVYVARDIIGFSDLGSAMSVATSGDRLLLTSWFDNAVRIWDPAADALVAAFTDFARPIDALAVGEEILVSEIDTGSVIRFDPRQPDARTAVAENLGVPAGLAVLEGEVYVADRASGTVLRILRDGEVVSPPEPVASDLAGPEGIAACGARLCVVEADAGRLSAVDPGSGRVSILAEGLELHVPSQGDFPATMLLNGVASDGRHAWVSGDRANVLYRVTIGG